MQVYKTIVVILSTKLIVKSKHTNFGFKKNCFLNVLNKIIINDTVF